MSTPFQNRLVGTIIVAAAIIIFLPDVLDGKKSSNQTEFDAIPKAPNFVGKMTKKPFPEEELVLKEKAVIFNEQAQDDQLFTNNETNDENLEQEIKNDTNHINNNKTKVTPATKVKLIANNTSKVSDGSAIEKPELGQQPPKAVSNNAWVIQLGSFKHKSNVAELVSKLKSNGYTVFTKPITTTQGKLTKVFIGPELIKSSLTKKLVPLKKLTNVQGKVARFFPTK